MIWLGSGLSIAGLATAMVGWFGSKSIPIAIIGALVMVLGIIIVFNATKFLKGRYGGWLSSPDLFARKPFIGWILFFVGGVIFALLAINLKTNGPLLNTDTSLTNAFHTTALRISKGMLAFVESGWYLGNEGVMLLGGAMGLYFLFRRYWKEFWMTVAGGVGSPLIFLAVSHIFNRHRPEFAVPVEPTLTGPGFPSGHAVIAIALYGLLAYLLLPRISSRLGKFVVVLITTVIILFIGFSRVFTGGHYLTDVLAGYAIGMAWAGISYLAIESYFVRRKKRIVEK
jgi:membrane-associated phospholipid phosphatase